VAPVRLAKEEVLRHDEELGTLPQVSVAWHSPAFFEPGDAVADVLGTALGTGRSSRLYKRLVLEKQLALSVNAGQQSMQAQSVFSIEVTGRPGVSTDTLLKEVDAVLEEVRREGVTAREVERARTRFETMMLGGLQSVGGFGGKADTLQQYNHFVGDPGFLAKDLARYDAVTPEQVKQFARDVLRSDARVVLHAVPVSKEGK
jgi:predicted Zn-dependent peptidase